MSYKEANDVLNYWFGGGDRSKRPRWFRGGEEATQEIRDKFETLVSESIVVVLSLSRNAMLTSSRSMTERRPELDQKK